MVKTGQVIGVAIVAAVGLLLYFLLKTGGLDIGVTPTQTGPSTSVDPYVNATTEASRGSLAVTEIFAPTTSISTSNQYQQTITNTIQNTVKAGLFQFG